jgi:hypothetical protein
MSPAAHYHAHQPNPAAYYGGQPQYAQSHVPQTPAPQLMHNHAQSQPATYNYHQAASVSQPMSAPSYSVPNYSAPSVSQAHYPSFGLGEEVRDFYAFLYRGELWRFKVLPMGLRHSVAIAHTATRMLLNYDMKGVHAEPYIDNIRFVGNQTKSWRRWRRSSCGARRSA